MLTIEKPSVAEIQRLKRERKNVYDKAVEARKAAKEADDVTVETRNKIEAMLSEVEDFTARIDAEERALAVADTMEEFEEKRRDENQETPEAKYSNAFRDFLQNGISEMRSENRSILTSNAVDTRALGVASGGVGGYLVPEDFYNQVVEIMQAYGGMRQGATILTTSGGNDLPVPKGDDTSNTGEIVDEGSQVNSTTDPTFTQMILKAYNYSSKIVRVGYALLQDEAVGFESLLANMLATRIGRITNTHFTTGDDTNKPDGIMNSAEDGSVTSTNETSVTYGDLVSLMHSVDPAYQANGSWMFNDGTLALIKKMQVGSSDARPLWVPGVAVREPNTILGKPYIVNQDMPAHTEGLKAMIFGDLSQYFIRDVRGMAMMRLTERYADYLQVGFMLFSRHDGGLAVPSAVKYLTVGTD